MPDVAATSAVEVSERELAALEDTKNSLKELQEEFSVYRREKAENERCCHECLLLQNCVRHILFFSGMCR